MCVVGGVAADESRMNDGDERAIEFARLVEQRVARMRPKLLDLSRRNPLVSTSLSGRSNALIRIVDELPEKVVGKLASGSMYFRPLPDLEHDPKDEDGREFQDALSNAKRVDEVFLEEFAALEARGDVDPGEWQSLDRALRDRVRIELGMEPRQTGADVSLAVHARTHGISPSFDLPEREATASDGRFDDRYLQTLMLAEDLERRLNGLLSKGKTWLQETGINVMHMAVGFIEWSDATATKPSFAPLLLAQVEIAKHKTPQGAELSVKLIDEEVSLNAILAQKLRAEFALELPKFDSDGSIEAYLERIAELEPRTIKIRVRRQLAFGVFPSARIAMFHDLEDQQGRFGSHPVVSTLLGGGEVSVASPFAPEYPVDDVDITRGLPPTVLDADSSQVSALVDVLDGKDIALEGPPGTGKSQTIVNVIAAAMARGKRVLFIAEKMAALEVVQSRLRSLDLDAFVLPLQATRSTREEVMQSLRDRLQLRTTSQSIDLEAAKAGFKQARNELKSYLSTLAAPYKLTGLTVHDVLGRGMGANERLASAPASLKKNFLKPIEAWTQSRLESARNSARLYGVARQFAEMASPIWRGVGDVSVDRFSLDAMRERAGVAAVRVRDVGSIMDARPELSASLDLAIVESAPLAALLRRAQANGVDLIAVGSATQSKALVQIIRFAKDCGRVQEAEPKFSAAIDSPFASDWPLRLDRLAEIACRLKLSSLDAEEILLRIENAKRSAERFRSAREHVDLVVREAGFWGDRPLSDMERLRRLASGMTVGALMLRDPSLIDAALRARVRAAAEQGAKLAKARDALLETFLRLPESSSSELRSASATLREANFIERFGGEFTRAKTLYRSLTANRRFTRLPAAEALAAVADFKDQFAAYECDRTLPEALPGAWHHLDTDFALIVELLNFIDALEGAFTGLVHKGFRHQVLACDLEVLRSLPTIEEDVCEVGKPTDLVRRTNELEDESLALEKGFEEIGSLVRGIRRPIDWNATKLTSLSAKVRDLQRVAATLDNDEVCRSVFGAAFQGWRTPIQNVEAVVRCSTELANSTLGSNVASMLRRAPDETLDALDQLAATAALAGAALQDIGNAERFISRVRSLSLNEAQATLLSAADDHASLQAHAELALNRRDLDAMGLGPMLDELEAGWEPQSPLPDIVDAVVYRCMALDVFETYGSLLGRFVGSKIDQLRKDIAEFDGRVVRLSRGSIRSELLARARPPRGVSQGKVSEKTQLALIQHETAKTRAFIPVRSLVDRAGQALLELKPCWMMSPLAVAQYVPPHVEFDLCIIDEASQMPPEDALGAVLRAKQVMIVGDVNQLPPTTFFKKLIDDGEDEEQEGETVVEESILEMANAVFRPSRRLRWHYRSKHGSLIAFSNNHIYDDNLIVFPSADTARADRGVSLVKVDGRYRSSVNPEEAKAIVAASTDFMGKYPDRSLGLVTVNQKQRDLILEELQTAANLDDRVSAYTEKWAQQQQGLEEFFVKNLENVQGDERDAIFISTVYGPPEPGAPMPQRFGPITGIAGRRRLNVLFSRAKQQIVTFTSMSPTDITADEHGNPGAYMLRCWLEYSATGVIDGGNRTRRQPDSEFEVFVMHQLASMGVEAVPQVGVAGYFVDIGVRHPDWPHGYILGVECDGASYHSASSARDRDRLRQSVLEGLGWRIHRIWSTDWFLDPVREAARLRNVIELRMQELRAAS